MTKSGTVSLKLAAFFISSSTTFTWPLSTALNSAVSPKFVVAFTSAPFSIKFLTIVACPNLAAKISGVQPSSFLASTFAPFFRGQKILEGNCGVFNSAKKTKKN